MVARKLELGPEPDNKDQLPEEAPPEQVPDDDGSDDARDDAEENAGAREGEEGESTGNPANAALVSTDCSPTTPPQRSPPSGSRASRRAGGPAR